MSTKISCPAPNVNKVTTSDAEPTADAPSSFPSGWVLIGERRRWWAPLAGAGVLTFVFFGIYGASTFGSFFEDVAPWPSSLLLGAVTAGVLVVAATLIRNTRYPQPWVNLDTDEIRAGRRTLALSTIDSALIPSDPATQSEILTLRLFAKNARVEIILRTRKGPRLDTESTWVLAEAIRRTTITMPTSIHDPSGKFARYNFPGHIDLDDTLTLVQHPPAPGKPLPASW